MSLSANNSSPRGAKVPPRQNILLVQAESSEPSALQNAFERNGFEVAATSTVKQSLSLVTSQEFDALVCDLHIPAPGDAFTLINAMRHFHPSAVTVVMSNYPQLKESVSALLPQADEILVTPVPAQEIVALLKKRLSEPIRRESKTREPVSTVLEHHSAGTISEWLTRVNRNKKLSSIPLSNELRTGHLPTLLNELVRRLRAPHFEEGNAKVSLAAIGHGRLRRQQGYTAAMLVEESRILQVCIFRTLRSNLSALDLSLVLTDVMTIADEVDSQLRQTMLSFSARPPRMKRVSAAVA
jgi:ActR/RegA family two-component response regulator